MADTQLTRARLCTHSFRVNGTEEASGERQKGVVAHIAASVSIFSYISASRRSSGTSWILTEISGFCYSTATTAFRAKNRFRSRDVLRVLGAVKITHRSEDFLLVHGSCHLRRRPGSCLISWQASLDPSQRAGSRPVLQCHTAA